MQTKSPSCSCPRPATCSSAPLRRRKIPFTLPPSTTNQRWPSASMAQCATRETSSSGSGSSAMSFTSARRPTVTRSLGWIAASTAPSGPDTASSIDGLSPVNGTPPAPDGHWVCGHSSHRESEQIMARFPKLRPGGLAAATATALALAASSAAGPTLPGSWRHVPPAPFTLEAGVTAVWTGRDVVVAGLTPRPGNAGFVNATENAAAFNPASNTWRALAHAPSTPTYCRRDAVWTGSQMLVWGCGATTYDPSVNRWRRLPNPPTGHGFAVWTGRELIGWGGGCCGDAGADGSAYNPAANTWRRLARSLLAPEQSPLAAWDGREVLVFVSGISAVNGRPLSARPLSAGLARGAAYDPAANRWRVLQKRPVAGGAGVWDGSELVVVGAGRT